MKTPRVCPECGSDTYFAENFDRIRDKSYAVEERMKRMAAQHAIAEANHVIRDLDRTNEKAWLARKSSEQAKVIRHLEQRLRDHGIKPYGPADTAVSSTAVSSQPSPVSHDQVGPGYTP